MTDTWPLLILALAVASGLAYRLRGGGFFALPGLVRRPLSALLLTVPIWFIAPWWAALVTVAVVSVFVSLGHGDWLDFGTSERTDPDEWLNPIVHLLTEKRDGVLHDMIGMALSGMSITLPAAIAAAWFAGPLFLLWLPIGALKAIAYWLGWNVFGTRVPVPHLDHPTAMAEFMTGFLLCGAPGLLWWAS